MRSKVRGAARNGLFEIPGGLFKVPAILRRQRTVEISRVRIGGTFNFFDRARVVVAWCELRQAFRHFRTDRIAALTATGSRYPRRRQALLKAWRETEGIRPQ